MYERVLQQPHILILESSHMESGVADTPCLH